MIDINEVYKKVQIILSKSQQGYVPPTEFNRLSAMASLDLFNHYYGKPDAYRYDKPLARIGYAQTQYISEALSPFIEEKVSLPVTSGAVSTPDEKIHTLDIEHTYVVAGVNKTTSFRRVEWNRLNNYLNSAIDAPTKEFPIYTEVADSLNIFPSTITSVKLTYLRTPINPNWAYTVVGNRPVYDSGTSVDFEWSPEEENNLIMRIVSLAGASLKDNEAISYSEASKKGD